MYIRPNRRRKNGADYEYWTLVETVRTARGPRQRIVGNLGKLPGLDEEERIGWEEIGLVLSGKRRTRQPGLFGPEPEPPDWARADLRLNSKLTISPTAIQTVLCKRGLDQNGPAVNNWLIIFSSPFVFHQSFF